jgi:hypothetical protein
MNTKMKKFYDPKLSLETLQTYQGYSLQVFTSGRIKLSFHISHTHRVEYYAERPKRFREAYAKQHQRSHLAYPDHFAIVEHRLEASPNTLIHRVHLKGDNNTTADHAHVLTDISNNACHVILGTLHHEWELPKEVTRALHLRVGPRRGAASIFNEYMPSYDHDWEDAIFTLQDYQQGYREPHKARGNTPLSPHDDELQF